MAPGAGEVGGEDPLAGALGDAPVYGPGHRVGVGCSSGHVVKAGICFHLGTLVGVPQELHRHGPGTGVTGGKGIAVRHALLRGPLAGLVVVAVGIGDIGKGGAGGLWLRRAVKPPQEGDDLPPGAGLLRGEGGGAGARGDADLGRPEGGGVVVGVLGHVGEGIHRRDPEVDVRVGVGSELVDLVLLHGDAAAVVLCHLASAAVSGQDGVGEAHVEVDPLRGGDGGTGLELILGGAAELVCGNRYTGLVQGKDVAGVVGDGIGVLSGLRHVGGSGRRVVPCYEDAVGGGIGHVAVAGIHPLVEDVDGALHMGRGAVLRHIVALHLGHVHLHLGVIVHPERGPEGLIRHAELIVVVLNGGHQRILADEIDGQLHGPFQIRGKELRGTRPVADFVQLLQLPAALEVAHGPRGVRGLGGQVRSNTQGQAQGRCQGPDGDAFFHGHTSSSIRRGRQPSMRRRRSQIL